MNILAKGSIKPWILLMKTSIVAVSWPQFPVDDDQHDIAIVHLHKYLVIST